MAMDVDRLEIMIEAEASKASAALDTLYNKLGNVSSAMGVSTSKYRSMARQINNLASAVQNFGNVSGNAGKGVSTINVQVNQMRTNATKTSKSFSDLANSAKKMASSLAGVGSAGKTAFSTMYNLIPNVVSQMKRLVGLSTGIDRTSNSFSGLLRSILPFISAYKLFGWAKESTELASSLTEVQNVVDHAFGFDGAAKVDKFAETSIQKYGIAALSAKQAASRFQSMGVTMGITADQVQEANQRVAGSLVGDYKEAGNTLADMSINLTKLTADLASFYDKDFGTVAEAMNSVYTGTTRPLRAYGIDLTQATLQEWANKQGIDAKVASMTQAQKAMLRYQYIIANTSMVMGDSERTADSWANTMRRLKQNFQALGATIGGVIVNAFGPLLRWMNNFIQNVNAFAETVANALGKIFGWTIKTSPGSLADTDYGNLASDLDDAAGGAGDLADDADDAAGGLGKAAKNAKELQRTILSFDEINKLNDTTTNEPGSGGSGGGSGSPSGGGAGAGGLGGNGATAGSAVLVQTDSLLKKFESEIDTLFKLGQYIGTKLKEALNSIKWEEDVYPAAEEFGTGLAEFLNGLFDDPTVFESVGNAVAGALNTALHVLDSFGTTFKWDKFGTSLGSGLAKFFRTWDANLSASVFKKFVNGIATAIKSALDVFPAKTVGSKISGSIKSALSGIEWETAVFPAARMFGTKLASFLNGLFNTETFKVVGETIGNRINASLQFLNSFGSTFNWAGFGNSIASAISNFFKTWDPKLTAATFTTFASGILTAIRSAIEDVSWETVGAKMAQLLKDIDWVLLLTETGKAIMAGINGALTAAESFFDGTPVSNAISTLKETINDIAEKIDFKTLSDGFKDIAEACAPFVEGFADGLVEAFSELAKIGVAVLRGIGVAFRIIANAIKSLPKGLVKDFGYGLGIVAAAMVTINGLDKVSGIIKGVVGTFKGLGGAAASGSTIAGSIGEIGTKSGTVKTAVMGLFKELTKSFGFMEGAGVIAATELGKGLQLLDEKTRGENGELSEMGGIMDTIATDFAPGTAESIRKLKDDLENNKVTTDEASTAFANFFTGQHITPEKVEEALIRASGQMNVTDEQAKLLEQTVQKMGEQMDSTADTVNMTEEDYNSFKEVLQYLQRECGLTQSAYDDIDQTMKNSVGSTTATQAYELFRAKLSEVGIESDTYKDKMTGIGTTNETTKGKVNLLKEAFTQLSTVAKQKITDMSSSATISYGNVKTALSNVSTQLGLTNDDISLLETTLYEQELSGATAEQAYNAVKNTLKKLSTNSDNAAKALDEQLDVALNNSRDSASDADSKISAMKSDLWKFAIGAGAKMILLAVINTAFQGFATDAEDAGSSMTTMQEDGSAALSTLGDDAEAAATKIGNALSMKDYDMWSMGYNVAQNLSNGMDAGLLLPKIGATWERWTYGNGGWFDLPSFSLSWFAKGGFPNMGQLFMANEAGPELVGKMGRRNVVANNMQITEGIREAVVDGMMEVAMATSNGDGSDEVPYVINMRVVTDDDETLARRVERGRMKRDARYNPTPAYA